MLCERINTCNFILCLNEVMPFTAGTVKSKYCKKIDYCCAAYVDHEVLAIDKEAGNLCPGIVMDELEIFEKKFSETYKKLCVRCNRKIYKSEFS